MAKNDEFLRRAATRFRLARDADREEREKYDSDVKFAWDHDGAQW